MPENFAPQSLKASDAVVRPVWSILSKGRTGTGKTIASCGKAFRPTYVFNLEGRFESVLTYYQRLDGSVLDLEYNDFNMSSGFYPLDQKMDAIVARPEYKTVVVSGLTPYTHIIFKHLMGATSKGARKKGGLQVNILEDYNFEDSAIIFELLGFLQTVKGMGVNVILECHISAYEVKTINEETGSKEEKTIFEILTKGRKAPAQIPGYFNEVWLFEKHFSTDYADRKAKYIINTQGTPSDDCKTSFGIPSFEWTDKDPTIFLTDCLKPELRDAPRIDPNAPKIARW